MFSLSTDTLKKTTLMLGVLKHQPVIFVGYVD